jgi:hypothetical protein
MINWLELCNIKLKSLEGHSEVISNWPNDLVICHHCVSIIKYLNVNCDSTMIIVQIIHTKFALAIKFTICSFDFWLLMCNVSTHIMIC